MKTLLIPFFFLAAVLTANAHCGSCGTGEAHAKSAVKADCDKAKADCGDKADCDKAKADCDKAKADCDKAKKDCADKADCGDKKDCADKSECDEGAKKACPADCTKPCCAKDAAVEEAKAAVPMPKMACCAKEV